MCPVEKSSFVITDRASQGGQEGVLSAGTRDGTGRDVKHRFGQGKWSSQSWTQGRLLWERGVPDPFLGDDCGSLCPW